MKLKSYDPDATCPKCGHDVVGTFHKNRADPLDGKFYPSLSQQQYLCRSCRRCHYQWAEGAIKAEEPE